MGDIASTRTQLTNEKLKQSVDILQDIINVCNACIKTDFTWSKACHTYNLDLLKTRRLILNLEKCTNSTQSLEDVKMDIYDGYEEFYKSVFGDRTMKQASLPFDYIDSVNHIIKNTGLTSNESLILMRHFGIVDYELPETLESIGNDRSVTKGAIRTTEQAALRKCRQRPRIDILRMGLQKYNLMIKHNEELHKQQLEHDKAEHEALMAKHDMEHKKLMNIIASSSYDEAVMQTLPYNISDVLKQTHIDVLHLSVRPNNALLRSQINNLFDLLKLDGIDSLMKLRHMGSQSAKETIGALNNYMQEKYAVTADKMRAICYKE